MSFGFHINGILDIIYKNFSFNFTYIKDTLNYSILFVFYRLLISRIHLTVKEKIAALRLLKECNEAKIALLEKGHSVLNVKDMEEKLEEIKVSKSQ